MKSMSKIGIIFCLYNCESTLDQCLNAWKQVKDERFVYSCVSAPFKGYEDFNPPKDNTIELVRAANIIDKHFTSETHLAEVDARGLCLQFLKMQECDLIWMVDGDEIYTVEDINKILDYVEKNQDVLWFKICLKNYVFDEKTYLELPFTPARIYRVSAPPFKLGVFYQDNDISFIYNDQEVNNTVIKNKVIPQNLVWVKHLTWQNNENSRLKCDYQLKRWNVCSYKWDKIENKLKFREEFYSGKQLPKVISEN